MNGNGRVRRRYGAKDKVRILEEGRQTGASISEVCRRHGISTAQYYQWEKQGREAMLERFAQGRGKADRGSGQTQRLQVEIARLKGVIAEITMENLELKKNFGP